jgi:hypothetical protein
MSKFTLSREQKSKLLVSFDSANRGFYRFYPRRDWYVSRDGKVHIFLTFGRRDKLWYDMDEPDLQELTTKKGYVIFLLGSAERYLCIPAGEIHRRLSQHTTQLTENGRYTFIVTDSGRSVSFTELPGWELSQYLNTKDFLG